MADNTVAQNPRNKVGRNSGAGPGGVSEVVPTRQEAERGLRPLRTEEGGRGYGRWGVGAGVVALLGAGAAAYTRYRARQKPSLRARLMKRVGL